jgi:Retrotransposon gag protein
VRELTLALKEAFGGQFIPQPRPQVLDPNVKLPLCKGDVDDTVGTDDWLNRAEAYFKNRHSPVEDMELRTSSLYSAFPAGTISGVWFANAQPFLDWGDFCTSFRARFQMNQAHRQRLTNDFDNLKQGNDQTVSEYRNAQEQLLENLASIKVEYSDTVILNRFIDNLRPQIRERVRGAELMATPDMWNIERFLTIAIQAEQQVKLSKSGNGQTPTLRRANVDSSSGPSTSRPICGYCKKPATFLMIDSP